VKKKKGTGRVFLVGAGPGDPGLITIKGLRCLREADVVIYDHLIPEEVLKLCPPHVRFIYAGKSGSDHTLAQEEINHQLVIEAKKGLTVVRLKGGDPFIFGRGGEEALVLREQGIPFEIVPGVSSAIAVPAYAGIPLTHRGHTSTLTFVTGHEDPKKEKSALDWEALARIGTLVFLMGVKNLPHITENLLRAGKPADTPAALIRWGTTPEQETLVSTLKDIAKESQEKGFSPPAILVVGSVVSLRKELNWFENLPLFGKGIVLTRPLEQSAEMAERLKNLGARVILFPTIEIEPPASWKGCDDAIDRLDTYHWIIFTSVNGVKFFFRRLMEKGKDVRDLKGLHFAAIGPTTAQAINAFGIVVEINPSVYTSEGLVEAFKPIDLRGLRILIPRAQEARDVLPKGLARLGAQVHEVAVYRTIGNRPNQEELLKLMAEGRVSCLTFTSPSTVKHFLSLMGKGFRLPKQVKVAVIGPVTKAYARECGLPVHIEGKPYTKEGLIEGIVNYFVKNENKFYK